MSTLLERLGRWGRESWRRLPRWLPSAIQVGVAAGAAWWLAILLLGVEDPVYAPIGAVVATGTGDNRLAHRPFQIIAGMLAAVAVAGAAVNWLGTGGWQIMVVGFATTLVGRALFKDPLARSYATFHGVVIGALGTQGVIPNQVFEAGIGGLTALVVVHVVFPPQARSAVLDTVQQAGLAARKALQSASLAFGGARGDDRMDDAITKSWEIDRLLTVHDGRRRFGRQLTWLSPARWRQGDEVDRAISADQALSACLLGVAPLVRSVQRLRTNGATAVPQISTALKDLDVAVGWALRHPLQPGPASDRIDDAVDRVHASLTEIDETDPVTVLVVESIRELAADLHDAFGNGAR